MDDDKIKALYEQLKDDGYQLDDEETFREDIRNDKAFQEEIYNAQKADGYDMGGDFNAWQARLMQNFPAGMGKGGNAKQGTAQTTAQASEAVKPTVGEGTTQGTAPTQNAMGLTQGQEQAIVDNVKSLAKKPLPTYEERHAAWEQQQHEKALAGAEMKKNAYPLKPKEPTLEEKAAQGEYNIANARETPDALDYYDIERNNPNSHRISINTKDYTDKLVNNLYAAADAEKRERSKDVPDYAAWGDDNGMRATQAAKALNAIDDPKRIEELALKRLKADEWAIKDKAAKKAHELQSKTDQYIDVSDFADYVYKRTVADTIAKVRNMAVEREKPKNTFEGVMGGIDESIMGNINNALTTTPEHVKARQEAAEQWRRGAGLWANVGRSTVGFVADTPFFGISGEVSGAVVRQIAKRELEKYVARGLSKKAAARVIQTKLANSFGKRMADKTMKGAVGGAVNLGTYEGMSEAASQYATAELKPEEIIKRYFHGAATGAMLGVTGGAWGEATAKLSGAPKILANVAGFGIEAGTFTATGEFEKWASGQGDQINWLEDFGENAAMILAMKASNPKHLLQMFNPKARQETNVPKFTDAEREEILRSRGGRQLYDLVTKGMSSKEEYAQAYERFVNDPDVSFTSKQKVSYALTEAMQRKTPEVTTYNIEQTADGKAVLTTRAADGMIVERMTFSTPEAAEQYGERLTAAIMQGETSRYSIDAAIAAAEEIRRELGISEEQMQDVLTGNAPTLSRKLRDEFARQRKILEEGGANKKLLDDIATDGGFIRKMVIDRFNLITTEREMKDAGRIEEQRALPYKDLQPIGMGVFGEIYDQFKGKAEDAAAFLISKRGGMAQGVFHREETGDIGLVWGNEKGGLEHIIEKHIIEYSDFDSVPEAMDKIKDVAENGKITLQNDGEKARIEKDGYVVVASKSEGGQFVLTAFDASRKMSSKKRSDADATLLRQSILNVENGTPVSQSTASEGEDTENLGTTQGNGVISSSTNGDEGIATPIVHEDGMVHKATLYPTAGGQAQEVFVVKGDIVMRADGTIDTEASSSEIYYRGVDGQTHVASPDKFQRADEPVSVEEIAAASDMGNSREAIEANETGPRIDTNNHELLSKDTTDAAVAPRFGRDDEVKITGADGKTYDGVVSGVSDNGNIVVDYEDAAGNMKRVGVPYDELARMMTETSPLIDTNLAQIISDEGVDTNDAIEAPVAPKPVVPSPNGGAGEVNVSQSEEVDVNISETEFDEDGSPFVKSSTGDTTFGEITSKTGLTPAPIKLSVGNSKYGLVHLKKRHGKQIKDAGFNSVEEFVEYVAKNYNRIQQGENSIGEDNGTYLLQIEDAHNNTLYIELSSDGSYWSVNSGGVFRSGYGNNKKNIWSASEEQNGQSATDNTLRAENTSDNSVAPNGNVSKSSADKDTESSVSEQGNREKVANNRSSEVSTETGPRIDTNNHELFRTKRTDEGKKAEKDNIQ